MKRLAPLIVLAVTTFTASAWAGGPGDAAGPPAQQPPTEDWHAAFQKQQAQLDALQAAFDEEHKERAEHLAPKVRVSGFLQVDWVVHNQESQNEINGSTGAPLNQDRFELRRGHLRIDAEQGMVLGAIEIDANTVNGPQVRPIEAQVSLRWPEKEDPRVPSLLLSAGLLRIPFGFEVQEIDWVRPFLERANMTQALFPGEFDLGVRAMMKYRFLNWGMAVMNGSPIGAKEFPDLDPTAAKEIVGRIGVDFEIVPGVRFQGGVSADTGTGFHPGTPATKPQLVWQDQNGDGIVEPNEIIAVGGSPATPSQLFHRFAVGGDARLIVHLLPLGDLTFRAEAIDALNLDRGYEVADPVAAGYDLREKGWSGAAVQEVTRWGMIGVRYDVYNPNADAKQQQALNLVPVDRTYSTLALMAMVHDGWQRLLLEYDVNRNPLGIGPNGAPTTLADNALTLRAQLVF